MELWEDQDLVTEKSGFQCHFFFFRTFDKLLNLPEPQLVISKMEILMHTSAGCCEDKVEKVAGMSFIHFPPSLSKFP